MPEPKKNIASFKGYDIPLFIENYELKLDSNENAMGPSPRVLEAISNISEKDIKYYPAYGEVLHKLAEINKISQNCILPTNGADESIKYIFDTFIEPKDTVLTVTPSFVMPKIYANTVGCEYKEIPYTKKWEFPVKEIINNINSKTKLIIITTPNNPTGEAISRENLLKILETAKNQYVMIDETYFNYCKQTFIDLVEKYPNILITRSMSKDYGLAGLRFGYILSQETNINHIKKIISPYSVNNIAAKAAVAALSHQEYLNYVVTQIVEARDDLSEFLKPFAKEVFNSDANFILADFGEKSEFVYKKLLNSGIKVKNFGDAEHLENCLRITVPSIADTQKIINALKPGESIIFDMDGVIVDTRNSYRVAIKYTYEYFTGKEINFEEIQRAKNLGGLNNDWDLTEFLLKQAGINISKEQIINKFQELYLGHNADGFILNEEILIKPESIAELAKTYDLAIYTGRPREEAKFVINRWNLDKYFLNLYAMEDVPEGFHKPDPYGINLTLNLINPTKAYYLGDTPDDMIAAKRAGVTPVGIMPPQDKSEELNELLTKNGAEIVLKNTQDLLELLKDKMETK